MSKIIHLSPDYDCEPLWDDESGDYLETSSLPISAQLKARIAQWQNAFNAILNRNNPRQSAFPSPQHEQDFHQEGTAIAQQLQAELGPSVQICYN